jgi:serine/threonine protein kinase
MSLPAGSFLGPYQIVEPLGAGGMGEVYRATDTRLRRQVAIKVVGEALGGRFSREARAIAALNHRNICTLHDVGPNYLVMELVEGETLAHRLVRGPLSIAACITAGVQIAEALEAAHGKGIVHRDLKPSNVMFGQDGSVKVLDFGVAKALSDPETSDLASSLTTTGATATGAILGTAAYMSPEQARGLPVDRRADIWAFGCVLFEMLAGSPAFRGQTMTDVLAAVIEREPDWQRLPPAAPSWLRFLVRRCLQKDPRRRLQDIGDARIELEDPPGDGEPHPAARAPRKALAVLPWVLTGALSIGLLWLSTDRRSAATPRANDSPIRMELNLPAGVELWEPFTNAGSVALSPDGSKLAFIGVTSGNRQIYIRRLDQFHAVAVPGTSGANALTFSPDSRSIAVMLITQVLQTIGLEDGLVVPLARGVDLNAGLTWGVDGRITFGKAGVLWQVPSGGGQVAQLTSLDTANGEVAHSWPVAVGGGGAIVFAVRTGASPNAVRIDALAPGSHQRHVVLDSGTFPVYAPSGHLIFSRDLTLLAVAFDPVNLRTVGDPVRVLNDARMTVTGAPTLAIAAAGTVAYTAGAAASRLVFVSQRGVETPIAAEPRRYANPRIARDGRIVVSVSGDVWVLNTERATFSRLTTDPTLDHSFPVWTPDGKRIWMRTQKGLQVIDADGGGKPQGVAVTSAVDWPLSVSPDGARLLFMRVTASGGGGDLYMLPLAGELTPAPFVQTVAYEGGAEFSPNGTLVAFTSSESGQFQVFVRPVAGSATKQLAAQSGKYPRWSADGKELFLRDGPRMMVVNVSATAGGVSISPPRQLFEGNYDFGSGQTIPNYDVTPDGRFVMVKPESGNARLNIVLNWFGELARLAPPSR